MQKVTFERGPILEPECKVSGGLLCILYIGRWIGVTPLSFHYRAGFYRARFSRGSCVAGYVFITVTCVLSISGLIWDMIGPDPPLRTKGGMTTAVWLAELVLLIITTGFGAFGAQGVTREIVHILVEKEKIERQLSKFVVVKKSETASEAAAVSMVTGAVVLMTFDYYLVAFDSGTFSFIQRFCYLFFYVKYFLTACHVVLFALLVQAVRTPGQLFNMALQQQLGNLESFIDREEQFYIQDLSNYNKIVDSLGIFNKVPITDYHPDCLDSLSQSVHELSRLHSRVAELPRAVDRSCGVVVVLLLMSLLLHLVQTPYYVITSTCKPSWLLTCVLKTSSQLVWMVYHLAALVAIVEPCHRSTNEAAHTAQLVSQLLSCVPARSSQLSRQLRVLSSVLAARSLQYSPMGMCRLDRALVASIMANVTTYLVILVQFQVINEQITY